MLTLMPNREIFEFTFGKHKIVTTHLYFENYSDSPKVPMHKHECFELQLSLDGSGTFIQDGVSYNLNKDTIFLGKPFLNHEIIYDEEVGLKTCFLTFAIYESQQNSDKSYEEKVIDRFLEHSHTHIENCHDIRCYVDMIAQYESHGGSYATNKILPLFLIDCLAKLAEFGNCFISKNDIWTKKINEYISQNIMKKITVDSMANDLNISKRALFYYFKEYLKTTPHEYIAKTKITLAEGNLRMGSNVSEVCEMFGFSELSSFSRSFKQYTGISPSQYQKEQKSKIYKWNINEKQS